MNWTRRDVVRLGGLSAAAWTGCGRPRPEPRLLPSLAPLPRPFEAEMPVPPVLQPAQSDGDTDSYRMTVQPAPARILPGLNTPIWGYNGVFPAPTIYARRGRRVSFHLENALPVPIVSHLHGGRTPPASDGYPTDFILPAGGFPQAHMHDPLARVTTGARDYVYENDQRAATLWYHDHRMDFTAPQVWRGLAGFYIIRDEEEERLPLPRGDRDIPLLICDRSFEADGSFRYPALDPLLRERAGVRPEYMGGVLGDVTLVNGAPWPKLAVSNVKYRFRILNASNARRYQLALAGGVRLVQIGSDGGLLPAPVAHRSIVIAPAERFDVVIDFSRFQPGASVAMADQISGAPVMRFDIVRAERDDSAIPPVLSSADYLRPEEANVTRAFDFSYHRGEHGWMVNGKPFDPARMDARPKLDSTEIWQLKSDFSHPVHLHLVHFQVLSHSGRPGPYDAGWKDTVNLAPGQTANILVRFGGHRGRYVFHCHNLEHEDMSMMANFEVI